MVVSYLVSALAALLSGLAYTEFVVDQPVAGGALNMVSSTFGELAGWCAGAWLGVNSHDNPLFRHTLNTGNGGDVHASCLCGCCGVQGNCMESHAVEDRSRLQYMTTLPCSLMQAQHRPAKNLPCAWHAAGKWLHRSGWSRAT